MAHYRILFIGNPDNLYNPEHRLFDDEMESSSGLYDYGCPDNGLMVNGKMVETAVSKEIDWKNSARISAIYREDEKKEYCGDKGVTGNDLDYDYNNLSDMLRFIKDNDVCTCVDVHL